MAGTAIETRLDRSRSGGLVTAVQRLAISRGITYAGGSAAFWALSAMLYEQTHSAAVVAAAALASFSVPAALSPVAGLFGDRHDRRRLMVASEVAGGAVFLALAVAGSPAALLGLRVVASVVSAPLVPAANAALPSLVSAEELDKANAAISKAGTAGALVGPAIAGLMLATVGGPFVFLLNTISFLVSAVLILSVTGDFRPKGQTEPADFAAGFAFLWEHNALRPVTVAYGVTFIGVGITIPSEIVLAANFGVGSIGYAALICLWGVGALLGAATANRVNRWPRRVAVIGIAALGVSAGFLTVGATPVFGLALLGMAMGGCGEGLWQVTQTSLVQTLTPDKIRSRVFAGIEAVMQIGIALGLMASGLVNATVGAAGAFAMAGAASLISALILFLRGLFAEAAIYNRPPQVRVRELNGTSVEGRSSPGSHLVSEGASTV